MPKQVTFALEDSRLPLRVSIYPHDATESIITTIRNFYGLYFDEATGIELKDMQKNTIIARYENFYDGQRILVGIIVDPLGQSPRYDHADDEESNHSASRHPLRTSRIRSPSPNGTRERRSASTIVAGKKGRSRFSRTMHGDHGDGVNGYSSGDGAPGSVSGKNTEPIGNTDISVENIVQGGRRKRAKFESSVGSTWLLTLLAIASTDTSCLGITAFCASTDASGHFQPFLLTYPTWGSTPKR